MHTTNVGFSSFRLVYQRKSSFSEQLNHRIPSTFCSLQVNTSHWKPIFLSRSKSDGDKTLGTRLQGHRDGLGNEAVSTLRTRELVVVAGFSEEGVLPGEFLAHIQLHRALWQPDTLILRKHNH